MSSLGSDSNPGRIGDARIGPSEHEVRPANLVDPGQEPVLSVVVIARNEHDRIGACIDSILQAATNVAPFEIVVVDSASTDGTVDVATDYPVTVLRIPEEHVVSCGAGRYVGDAVARGDYVLHVDGDMTLTDDWLGAALDHLQTHDVAAVEGWLNDVETSQEQEEEGMVRDVDKVGGVMLFDRDALEAVGGFEPYLRGYEDVSAGYRLTTSGHRLVRLPMVSATHPVPDDTVEVLREPLRRWRAGYHHGVGQAIRDAARSPRVRWMLLRRQRYKLALLAWLVVGALSATTGVALAGWSMLSALAFIVVVRERGVAGAVQFLVSKTLGIAGIVAGARDPVHEPATYPLDEIEVVDEGPLPAEYVRERLQ